MSDNTPIRICVNRKENMITFRIKTGYYLERSTPETMKLLRRTKDENVPVKNVKIEITEAALAHYDIVNDGY